MLADGLANGACSGRLTCVLADGLAVVSSLELITFYKQAVASLPDNTCDQMNNDVESRCHL